MAENVTITIEDGDDVTINIAEAQDGAAATIAVGTTTTGNAGTNASVTNSGTTSAAVLNFTIPRGATGANGTNGATGPAGPNSITSATTSDGTADITIAGLTLDGSATFIGEDIIIESTLDIQTADFTFGTGSAQAFKDALEIVSNDVGDATSDAVLNPQKVLKTNAFGGLTLGKTFIEADSNLTALDVASVDGIGANVYSETGTGGLFGSSSGIGGNLYSDGAGTGALIASATGTGADISTDDGTAIIAMSGTGKIISGNNATTEVFAVSNAGVVQASGLNLTGTSYTYGAGAATAHRTALASPSTSEVMPFPSIGASVRFAFFDDFMNVTGSPWTSTGTGSTSSTAPAISGGARHIGCVNLTTGSATNHQRGYFLNGESGQSLIGTTYHALFAITDPTNCAIYIGSGGGSDVWGLSANSSTNSGQWVINQNGTITTFTSATPQAGNMGSSGKRYRLALTKTSATQVYVRLEIADWNSGTWTAVHDGSVTVNSYSGGFSAANAWFHVTTLTTATRSLIMDYFGITHTIVR